MQTQKKHWTNILGSNIEDVKTLNGRILHNFNFIQCSRYWKMMIWFLLFSFCPIFQSFPFLILWNTLYLNIRSFLWQEFFFNRLIVPFLTIGLFYIFSMIKSRHNFSRNAFPSSTVLCKYLLGVHTEACIVLLSLHLVQCLRITLITCMFTYLHHSTVSTRKAGPSCALYCFSGFYQCMWYAHSYY